MKKIIIAIISLIILAIVAGMFMLRGSSGYRSIYFVPDDAIAVIETKDPVQAWDKIVHSKVWEHLKTNSYFNELNTDVQTYDSLVNSNSLLLKVMGAKPILMSVHETTKGEFNYIYIIDVGKFGHSKNPEKLLRSVVGENYNITSRKYNNTKIIEVLDIEASEYYFLTLTEGNLIFSFEPKLLEKAIDASIDKKLGLDTKFLTVQSKISHKGLFNVYLNYNNISNLAKSFSTEYAKTFTEYSKYLSFTGLNFNVGEEGLITVEGFTSFKHETPDDYFNVLLKGNSSVISSKVIPQRVASFTKINFDDAETYFHDLMKNMGEEVLLEYDDNIETIEKKLKISLANNLFEWMDSELVFVHTQPSNLGRNNEFAVVLNASDSVLAANNLNLIWKQIKKNTPVKVKSISYQGYKIDYVAFPGIIQAFFGSAIKQMEKPYFTQIGSSVILSNHPQTIKNIIDDYKRGNTLSNSLQYYNFTKLLEKESGLLFYFEPPVFFQNMKGFVNAETWRKLKKQKKYITCFQHGGVNVNMHNELLHLELKIQYEPEIDEWHKQFYSTTEIQALFTNAIDSVAVIEVKDSLPKILISDLDSKKHEELYDNGKLKLEVKLKNGVKDGTLKMYHENGKLSLKGEYENDKPIGKWKYYNENGDLVKTDSYK